jgi:hypothetical protein
MSQDEEANRKIWARRAAERIIDGTLTAIERLPKADHDTLLREIARRAIWHMRSSDDELRQLRDWFKIENLRPPHPGDDLPEDQPGG